MISIIVSVVGLINVSVPSISGAVLDWWYRITYHLFHFFLNFPFKNKMILWYVVLFPSFPFSCVTQQKWFLLYRTRYKKQTSNWQSISPSIHILHPYAFDSFPLAQQILKNLELAYFLSFSHLFPSNHLYNICQTIDG